MVDAVSSLSLDTAMASMRAAQSKMDLANNSRIDKTATDFTAMFMSQMMQPMVESVEVDQTFGGGHGEQIMRSFMVQEYGRIMAQSGKMGMTDAIRAELIKHQSAAAATAQPLSTNAQSISTQ